MGVYFYGIFEIDERMAEGSNLRERIVKFFGCINIYSSYFSIPIPPMIQYMYILFFLKQ